jgi:two-component system alkaline phosphatase synthesis response regulator PhoP
MKDETYAELRGALATMVQVLNRIEREERDRREGYSEPTNGHANGNGHAVLEHGVVIDRASMRVWVEGKETRFTPNELRLLMLMAAHEGEVLPRETLLRAIWKGDPRDYDSRTVDVHIGRLRGKLERNPREPQHIITVRGFGWRFENP